MPWESKGEFILEEEQLHAAIQQVVNQTLTATISQSEEGVVLQLIDREDDRVISICKVKSIEF